jgi:DME family drug/metabolite transporter
MVMVAGLLWGTTGIIGKMVYSGTTVGPIQLAWYRLIFAIPVLAAISFAKHYRLSITKRELWLFAAFGFISLTVFEALYFTSFDYTTVQHAAALLYTAPAFVAIMSRLILKEHFSRNKILAVALSITGAFLVMGALRGEPLFASRTQVGDWLGLGSGLAYSSWYIFGKVLGKNREPAVTSLVALCFGAIFLFPLMFALEGLHPPSTLLAWELVGTIGIVPTAMAYLFYLGGLKLIEATKASVFAIVEPVSAAFLAFLILGETLSYDSFAGFVLIISSIMLISTSKS